MLKLLNLITQEIVSHTQLQSYQRQDKFLTSPSKDMTLTKPIISCRRCLLGSLTQPQTRQVRSQAAHAWSWQAEGAFQKFPAPAATAALPPNLD